MGERCGREQRCRGRGGGLQHFIGRTNEARGKLPGAVVRALLVPLAPHEVGQYNPDTACPAAKPAG